MAPMVNPSVSILGSLTGISGPEQLNLLLAGATLLEQLQATPANGDTTFAIPANARGVLFVPSGLAQTGLVTPTLKWSTAAGGPAAALPLAADSPSWLSLSGAGGAFTLYVNMAGLTTQTLPLMSVVVVGA